MCPTVRKLNRKSRDMAWHQHRIRQRHYTYVYIVYTFLPQRVIWVALPEATPQFTPQGHKTVHAMVTEFGDLIYDLLLPTKAGVCPGTVTGTWERSAQDKGDRYVWESCQPTIYRMPTPDSRRGLTWNCDWQARTTCGGYEQAARSKALCTDRGRGLVRVEQWQTEPSAAPLTTPTHRGPKQNKQALT